jgi:uncharacterized OB-fold protein
MSPPAPTIDEHSAPFWAGLAERRIVLQVCAACHRRRFPRLPACPYCGTSGGDDVDVPGTGVVYSFVRAQRALTPAFAGDVPYSVATVELDGGGRIVGRVVPPESAAIGVRVEPCFVDHDGWTELRFTPAPPP